jgi:hypothetical protein
MALIFLSIFGILLSISGKFAYEIPLNQKPSLILFILIFLAGTIYLCLIPMLKHSSYQRKILILIFTSGLLFRILMLYSTPILEDDFYRYLWDGAVTSSGINPYVYSPKQILANGKDEIEIPERLLDLAEESGMIIHRINHPYVRTIYPLVAQVFFAISYKIKPWSVIAWRHVLLAVDLMVLLLILLFLKYFKISPLWIAIYWWNPLLIQVVFNAGHMDILIFPFMLGAIYMALNEKYSSSAILLALATCVKLWPILLFPIIFRPIILKPKKIALPLIIFLSLLILASSPTQPTTDMESSAFANYGKRWEMNDSLFKIILVITQAILQILGFHQGFGQFISRIVVLMIIFSIVFYLSFTKYRLLENISTKILVLITAIFLLSPTQFPWYYTWMLPLLVLNPRLSLLILTPLLSIYYLRYFFDGLGRVELFDHYIVWIQYIPVWILLMRDWIFIHRRAIVRLP